jgi:hypothetical protein
MEALANLVAASHVAYFLIVVGGPLESWWGRARAGDGSTIRGSELGHLLAVLLILAEDVFRFPCALNVLESRLRYGPANSAVQPNKVSGVFDVLLRHNHPGLVFGRHVLDSGRAAVATHVSSASAFSKEGCLSV